MIEIIIGLIGIILLGFIIIKDADSDTTARFPGGRHYPRNKRRTN